MEILKLRVSRWPEFCPSCLFLFYSPVCAVPSLQASPKQEAVKTVLPRHWKLKTFWPEKHASVRPISADGKWFVYSLTPNEGDSELLSKRIDGSREYRFSLGEAPEISMILLSYQMTAAGWLSSLTPLFEETKKLRKDKKRIEPKASLVELTTGQKTDWPGVRKIAFPEKVRLISLFLRLAPESRKKTRTDGQVQTWF